MKSKQLIKLGALFIGVYLITYYWEWAAGFLASLIGAAVPLFVGAAIAYLVNILMNVYEKWYFPKKQSAFIRKTRRPVSMTAAFLTLVAIIVLIFSLVLPQLISCIQLLISSIPGVVEQFVNWITGLPFVSADMFSFLQNFDWESKIGGIAKMLTTGVGDVMGVALKVVSSVVSGTITGVLSIIFSFYLLGSKDRLRSQTKRVARRYLKADIYRKAAYFIRTADDCFHRYIVGQCTEAVILGVLCTLSMLLFRLPYATMVGALIAFTSLIPIAGAYIGAGLAAVMILAVSPIKALIFLILIVALQQFEGNLIYPKVVGASIGLPGIWVLAAVTVGGGILGIPGMLLGVPLVATFYRIIRDDVNKKEHVTI